jgi:signal transduction histidine kinase
LGRTAWPSSEVRQQVQTVPINSPRTPDDRMQSLWDASWDEPLSCVMRIHERALHSLRTQNPADLFDGMAEALIGVTHADSAAIQVADGPQSLLRLAAYRGSRRELDCLCAPDGEAHSLCVRALDSHHALRVDDVELSTELQEIARRALLQSGVAACLLVPLVGSSGRGVGSLTACFRSARTFTDEQIRHVDLIADHSVTFVETIGLYRTMAQQLADERVARERAEALNRHKDQFIATLSHELRQPLSAALPAIELQKRSLSAERRHRAREVIEEQLLQIARLVEDLVDVSHISRGTLDLRLERVDLRLVVRQAIGMTQSLFDARGQCIDVVVGDHAAWLSGDAARLKQVFSNLLRNAASYTPAGGRIALSLEQVNGEVMVRVRDSGVGIPRDALNRIFTIFDRGDGHGPSQGLGIGLAIVRQIVELHGGTVSAASDGEGHGSEFVVRLPASERE